MSNHIYSGNLKKAVNYNFLKKDWILIKNFKIKIFQNGYFKN